VRDVDIPLAITAVDINSADTVFFTTPLRNSRTILNAKYHYDATLSDAVRASISIPGVFRPKKYNNMTLVDGAVKNNLPTDILHHMGANIIIAVDLGYSGHPNYNIDTIGEVLMQCLDILEREITLLKAEQHADVIIRPDIFDISFKDLRHINRCIHRGEKFANERIPEIKQLIANYINKDKGSV
jgi:NTE family protein